MITSSIINVRRVLAGELIFWSNNGKCLFYFSPLLTGPSLWSYLLDVFLVIFTRYFFFYLPLLFSFCCLLGMKFLILQCFIFRVLVFFIFLIFLFVYFCLKQYFNVTKWYFNVRMVKVYIPAVACIQKMPSPKRSHWYGNNQPSLMGIFGSLLSVNAALNAIANY